MDPDFLDRRTAIRFPLNSERALSVSELIETRLLDISLGGVSFRSSKAFEMGERITIGNDLLTPTMKIKRDLLEARYERLIGDDHAGDVQWEGK